MTLKAIKSDLESEINHGKLETAYELGYTGPQKFRLTKGLGLTSKLFREKG